MLAAISLLLVTWVYFAVWQLKILNPSKIKYLASDWTGKNIFNNDIEYNSLKCINWAFFLGAIDILICGRCNTQYEDIEAFLAHKQAICSFKKMFSASDQKVEWLKAV